MSMAYNGYSQADDCATATNLGTLPGNGGIHCENGTTIGSTPTFPPYALNGCNGGNIPGNIPDVWYQFVASENTINVDFTSLGNVINNPAVTLWQDACDIGSVLDCGVGVDNNVSMQFVGLIPGNTYWLLFSGTGVDGFGDFDLCIESIDLITCVQDQVISISPPPVNGQFLIDVLVEICISIEQPFDQSLPGVDWFHGMVPSFGSGWDQSTINPTQIALSCSGSGDWGWYTTCTGVNTNPQNPGTVGPGFFYDTPGGAPGGALDGIPGNNWGDDCDVGSGFWDFCFTIRTNDASNCVEGDDLSINWVNYTDSETGIWDNPVSACPNDPELSVLALLTCCPPPDVIMNQLGCDGVTVASIEVTGVGTGPFDYTWSTGFNETHPLGIPSIISGLVPGIYWVFIEDLGDGCTTQRSFTVDPPSDLEVDAGPIQSVCFGEQVTLTPTVTGGNPTYSYSWTSQPAGFTSNLESPTFGPITEATVFHLEVTDLSLCRETDPTLVTIDNCGTPLAATFTQIDVLCFGESTGSIDIIPTGGTPPLQYVWDHGPTTEDVSNLSAGNYSVTITDGAGQSLIINVTILEAPQMNVMENVVNSACNVCDGSIMLTPNGGTPGYLYSFNGGPFLSTNSWTSLCPGPYDIIVQDANLCEQSFNYVLTSATLNSTLNTTTIDCFGDLGQIIVTASGGTPPYEYSLDGGAFQSSGTFNNVPGGLHTVTTQDGTGCQNIQMVTLTEPPELIVDNILSIHNLCFGESFGSITIDLIGGTLPYEYALNGGVFQFSNQFQNLAAGSYIIDIRDENNCTIPSINVTITEPPELIISETIMNTSCGACDGSIDISLLGGTPGYEFSINGSPFQPNGSFTNLCPNSYEVIIRDANLCGETRIYDLNSGSISSSVVINDIQCFGELGQIIVTASGNDPPFQYSLDGGPFQSSGTFNNVSAGAHNVVIEDNVGCQTVELMTLTEPSQMTLISVNVQDNLCFGQQSGEIIIIANGGILPYMYSIDGVTYQSNNLFQNLDGGDYNIFVQDANGCVLSGTTVNLNEPPELIIQETIMNSTCGACDGNIELNSSGGTPGYEYSINGEPFQSSGLFLNLCPNLYTVIVRDANLCQQTFIYDLNSNALTSTIEVNDIACYGELGQIIVEGIGGEPPFTYSLNGGSPQSNGTFNNVSQGTYNITIEDVNGCLDSQIAIITEPEELQAESISVVHSSCFESNDGEISINAVGGTEPYEYALIPGTGFQPLSSFIGLGANNYELTIRDANGCELMYAFEIMEPEEIPSLSIENLNASYCDNEEPVEFSVNVAEAVVSGPGVSQGNSPSTYVFTPSGLNPGIYVIVALLESAGNNGVICRRERSLEVIIHPTTEASFVGLESSYCWNNPDIELIGTPQGGIFEGDGISNSELITQQTSAAGTIDISYIYTNEFGCTDIETQEVEISGPKISIEDEINVNFGDSIILAPILDFDWTIDGIEYVWEPPLYLSCTDCPNPVVIPMNDVIYTVTAIDQNGCSNEQDIRINAVKDFRVFIPSAFTPNGDGKNDVLVFNSNWVSKVNYFRIFDRWGQLVFEANEFEPNNENHGWDGRFNGEDLNGGSYVYYTEFVFADGNIQTKSGSVTLLK